MNVEHWQKMYEKPLEEIPWEIGEIPEDIGLWFNQGFVKGNILDIGCGTGNYSIWFAKNGCNVTGIDFSSNAIEIAKKKAKGMKIEFVCDSIMNWKTDKKFDFILEYSMFHHVNENDREDHAKKISSLLNKNGLFGMVCYSDKDPDVEGNYFRIGKFGNKIFHATRQDIEKIFSKYFVLIEYKATKLGKRLNHDSHGFVWKKK